MRRGFHHCDLYEYSTLATEAARFNLFPWCRFRGDRTIYEETEERQRKYTRNIEARSCNPCCSGKEVLHIVSVW